MRNLIKNYFFPGLLFFVPLVITVYVIVKTVTTVDKIFLLLPPQYRPENILPTKIPGLGLVVTFIVILCIGVLAKSYIGSRIMGFFENLVKKIPLVGAIHSTLKDFLQAILGEQSKHFRHVVAAEFPRKGMYSIGFLTAEVPSSFYDEEGEEKLVIFIPTTPNPTSGFLVAIPKKDVKFLDISVEDAFKFILTAGTTVKEVK